MSTKQPIDVSTILQQLRREVRAARDTLSDDSPHAAQLGVDLDELRDAVAEVEALRAVSAHWPLTWHTPRQRAEIFVQRLIRRALRWYIAPIVEQQNAYNNAVARALQLLVDANRQLAAEVTQLRAARSQESPPSTHSEDHG
ncbi:MAG TPA: hypothetical protein VGD69_21935 [Herpetosiphonaceae bacterium]